MKEKQMTEDTQKLEISPEELELIASALETQTKILRMQASAGGHGAVKRLNEVKRLLANITSQREPLRATRCHNPVGFWGLLRSMGQAT
jgi:ribosomal protein L29